MSELYEKRMVVLLETGPQTNLYNQLLFSHEQSKELSTEISKHFIIKAVGDKVLVEPRTTNVRFKLHPDIKTWYEEGERTL